MLPIPLASICPKEVPSEHTLVPNLSHNEVMLVPPSVKDDHQGAGPHDRNPTSVDSSHWYVDGTQGNVAQRPLVGASRENGLGCSGVHEPPDLRRVLSSRPKCPAIRLSWCSLRMLALPTGGTMAFHCPSPTASLLHYNECYHLVQRAPKQH